ncbi:hypothetical protein [Scandinavium manionii]|uniref:hypothetical protein n=1 Tax=Scandinavium manionii TaxID=2926520 RepID=UPI002165054A|nr:hypothetical protein [Scandinavium manionii]MCS2147882.1 hypothetical protein [Scandinavium manionii]
MTNNKLTPECVDRLIKSISLNERDLDRALMRCALAELQEYRKARVVPGGWVAVPANPTGDMLARIKLSDTWTIEALTARYKDMLRAAPEAPRD